MHLALLVSATLLAGGQTVTETEIVDHDYCFSLSVPGEDWRLMPEEEARKVIPQAIAGVALGKNGMWGLLVIAASEGGAAKDFLETAARTMPAQDVEILSLDPVEYLGKDAFRSHVLATVNGMRIRFIQTCFVDRDHLHQFIAWGFASETAEDGSDFEPIWGALHLAEGTIVERNTAVQVPDMAEGGWRVQAGRYTSASYGIVVEAKHPWRLLAGQELARVNANAAVGLICAAPSAFVVVIPERVAGLDHGAFADGIRRGFVASTGGTVESDATTWKVGGRDVEFAHVSTAGTPSIDYYHAIHFEGDTCYQVLAWCASGFREKALRAFPDGLASLSFLDEAGREKAAAHVEEVVGRENRVSATYYLRGGKYCDFQHGFVWRRPKGLWGIRLGDQAQIEAQGAILSLEEESLGVMGMVFAEDAPGYDAAAYHDAIVDNITGEDGERLDEEPIAVPMGARQALSTRVRKPSELAPFVYRILTTTDAKGHAIRMVLWAFEGNMKAAEGAVDEAARAFDFPKGGISPAVVEAGGIYSDIRMGFLLRTPAGWKTTDQTPQAIASVGSLVHSETKGQIIQVLALYAIADTQDEAWMTEMLTSTLSRQFAELGVGEAKESGSTIAGRDCKQVTWEGTGGRIDAFVFMRARTGYGCIVLDETKGAGVPLEDLKKAFGLLD